MPFGPFELQACGENDYTMKTLGLLAFRPDLRARLVRKLVGDDAMEPGEEVSILFFASIGENFFREAIEREYAGGGADFLLRCNLALGLPQDFRWRRNVDGRLTQPAKWQVPHMEDMLADNGHADDARLLQRLKTIQNDLNTEPDVVLQWGRRLAFIEVKVLSGQGADQTERQHRLADFLVAVTGLERADRFLLAPAGSKPPTDRSCHFIAWKEIADWFDDIPEIVGYVRQSAFFYKGSWRTMISPVKTPPGKTAWDLMLAAPVPDASVGSPDTARESGPEPAHLSRQEGSQTDDDDPWAFHHLGYEYFARIVEGCRHSGIWPLHTIWTGVTGNPYAEKRNGARIDPNWMVEDTKGVRYTRTGGFETPRTYNASRMRAWSYAQIAEHFGFDSD